MILIFYVVFATLHDRAPIRIYIIWYWYDSRIFYVVFATLHGRAPIRLYIIWSDMILIWYWFSTWCLLRCTTVPQSEFTLYDQIWYWYDTDFLRGVCYAARPCPNPNLHYMIRYDTDMILIFYVVFATLHDRAPTHSLLTQLNSGLVCLRLCSSFLPFVSLRAICEKLWAVSSPLGNASHVYCISRRKRKRNITVLWMDVLWMEPFLHFKCSILNVPHDKNLNMRAYAVNLPWAPTLPGIQTCPGP